MTSIHAKHNFLVTAAVFSGLLFAACLLIFFGSRNDAVSKAQDLKTGVVTAHQIRLAFQNVGGRILERPFEESAWVAPGDVLMRIDPTDTDLTIASLQAQIRSLDAQIAFEQSDIDLLLQTTATQEKNLWRQIEQAETARRTASAQLKKTTLEWNRTQKLAAAAAVSTAIYDQVKADYIAAQASLAASERNLQALSIGATQEQLAELTKTCQATGMHLESIDNQRQSAENRKYTIARLIASREQLQASLRQEEINRSRLNLLAPEAGKIIDLLYEPGDVITPGAPALLLETTRRYVEIYVPETQTRRFAPGTRLRVYSPALDREFDAVVRLCEVAPDYAALRFVRERGQADLMLFRVRLDLTVDSAAQGLLTGMTLEVRS